jgi:hypothetical protein
MSGLSWLEMEGRVGGVGADVVAFEGSVDVVVSGRRFGVSSDGTGAIFADEQVGGRDD